MRTNNKVNRRMVPTPGIEPGPHWWEASAVTTSPSLLLLMPYGRAFTGTGCFLQNVFNVNVFLV